MRHNPIALENDDLDESLIDANAPEAAQNLNLLTVIEPAQMDQDATRPNIPLNTIISGILGFMVVLGVIFLFEYLDDSVFIRVHPDAAVFAYVADGRNIKFQLTKTFRKRYLLIII